MNIKKVRRKKKYRQPNEYFLMLKSALKEIINDLMS
jgi:hypothetical protein